MNKKLEECLACGGENLYQYLDLGTQPYANDLKKTPGESKPTEELRVNLCLDCFHSQLSVIVDPKALYKDYKYVSGTTETLKKHFQSLAHSAVTNSQGSLISGLNVLDIGSNDGTLLSCFKDLHCEVQGIDPAETMLLEAAKNNIPTTIASWPGEWFQVYDKPFHIITACNVFAHNPNPLAFLRGCKRVLHAQGKIIIEFPYGKNTFQETQFGQIYHEHISYFNVNSFVHLAERAGLAISKVDLTPIHGGSIRFTLQKSQDPHSPKVAELIREERKIGMHLPKFYNQFSERIKTTIIDLDNTFFKLWEEKSEEECKDSPAHAIGTLQIMGPYTRQTDPPEIYSYGASAKSTVLFNHPKSQELLLTGSIIGIVDDNSNKHGFFSPGTLLKIESPEILNNKKGIVILVNAFNFKEEIKKRLTARGASGKLISYTPEVIVEGF